MVKCIEFDDNANIINRKNNYDICNDYVPFANRIVLNEWCDSDFNFYCSNGVFVENFFNKEPWQIRTSPPKCKYFWGNDSIKKIEKSHYIFGASPFVYSKKIYDNSFKFLEKYQVVFLPKSDNKEKTQLINKRSLCHKFRSDLLNLKLTNPIYISSPTDYGYYNSFFTNDMSERLYSLGLTGYDYNWNDTLLKVILHSSELYFNIISTPCIFSSFLNKKVKFYDSDLQYLPKELHNNKFSCFTVDKRLKNSEWHSFMTYIKEVFENKTTDLNFWIYNFLSLDKIKNSKELYEDLMILHNNFNSEKHLLTIAPNSFNIKTKYSPYIKNNDHDYYFLKLKEKARTFEPTNYTKTALYYYELL